MESLLKDLKKHVTCSICLDTYTKPKTIACLHTFCCECLERHALTSQKQGFYRCPECQAQIGIPEGKRFDNLPSSFLHNSLLSLLAVRRSGEGSEISCSTCQKKSAEINYCFDCEKFMCGRAIRIFPALQAFLWVIFGIFSYFLYWSSFQLSIKSDAGLLWFCFTSLCDWSRKLASQS